MMVENTKTLISNGWEIPVNPNTLRKTSTESKVNTGNVRRHRQLIRICFWRKNNNSNKLERSRQWQVNPFILQFALENSQSNTGSDARPQNCVTLAEDAGHEWTLWSDALKTTRVPPVTWLSCSDTSPSSAVRRNQNTWTDFPRCSPLAWPIRANSGVAVNYLLATASAASK